MVCIVFVIAPYILLHLKLHVCLSMLRKILHRFTNYVLLQERALYYNLNENAICTYSAV